MRNFTRPKMWGILLICFGVLLLIDNIFPNIYFEDYILPGVLIAVGISFFLPKE